MPARVTRRLPTLLDGVFFLDLPGSEERSSIWPLYLDRYGIDERDRRPDDRDWTGAEIASCCRLAALLGVPLREAATHVVPVAVTAAESVERLRTWAAGRCLSASLPGVYARGGNPTLVSATGRKVSRPSAN